MSDWDTNTIIGSRARAGGSGPRANVARSQGQINAARRQGLVVSVDKKYGSTNTKGDNEGQRLTMVDRETDIVKPKKLDANVGKAISRARTEKKMSQKDLPPRSTKSQPWLMTTKPVEAFQTSRFCPRWKEPWVLS